MQYEQIFALKKCKYLVPSDYMLPINNNSADCTVTANFAAMPKTKCSIFISIMCTVAGTEDVRIDNYQIIWPSMRSRERNGGKGTVESDFLLGCFSVTAHACYKKNGNWNDPKVINVSSGGDGRL